MSIFETLALKTGTSIARLLLRRYLAGDVGAIVAHELVDLAATRITSARDRREAARQFQKLADDIVDRLVPLFETESRRADLNLDAVAVQLGMTLDGRIDAAALLADDLDPERLTRAFDRARPLPPGHLSAAETDLHRRALALTVRSIVGIADTLPRFQVDLAAAQLARLSRMADVIDRTLASVQSIERAIARPDDGASRFEADYLQAMARHADTLELFGAEIDAFSRRYRLTASFLPPTLTAPDADGDHIVTADSVFNALRRDAGRLLIRGEAGGGKTTLLKWAAITAGEPRSTDLAPDPRDEDGWTNRVPFFIRLRDGRRGNLPALDDFILPAGKPLGSPPDGWVRSTLASGRGLVLIDGVDEVPPAAREHVYAQIRDLVETYPSSACVVTTRPAAVREDWLAPLAFREARMNPMSASDRDRFIDRWHAAVGAELARVGRDEADLPELADRLKVALRDDPPIARLATNPLLAAMVCALHRDRRHRLPQSLAELCEALGHMLLHRRERESGLDLDAFPAAYGALSYDQKRDLVRELAHAMVVDETSVIERDRAVACLAERMEHIPGRRSAEAPEVLDGLVERSGMLREVRPGAYDFIHNTFKDHLAADLFVEDDDLEPLVRNALEPMWQPIVIFAAATRRRGIASRLIARIMPASTPTSGRRRRSAGHERAILAIRMQAVAQDLDPALVPRLDALRDSLFPPLTLGSAEALATAGDVVVPFLRRQGRQSARRTVNTIRTLRLIDTPLARACLEDYLDDRREPVVAELAQAVNPLRLAAVATELRAGRTLPPAVAQQIVDVAPVAAWADVTELDLADTAVRDVRPLAGLTGLESLDLSRTEVIDFTPLAGLTALRRLGLTHLDIPSLDFVAGMSRLAYLNVEFAGGLTRIDPLAGLAALEMLDLSGTAVGDLAPVAQTPALATLDITSTPVRDLRPLAGLASLRTLTAKFSSITGVEAIATCAALEEIELDNTGVSDLAPLVGLPRLRALSLNGLHPESFAPLAGLAGMQRLSVGWTEFRELDLLAGLGMLRTLLLRHTPVSDLRPLAGLAALEVIDLVGTGVEDLSPLVGLPRLRLVRLSTDGPDWPGGSTVDIQRF